VHIFSGFMFSEATFLTGELVSETEFVFSRRIANNVHRKQRENVIIKEQKSYSKKFAKLRKRTLAPPIQLRQLQTAELTS